MSVGLWRFAITLADDMTTPHGSVRYVGTIEVRVEVPEDADDVAALILGDLGGWVFSRIQQAPASSLQFEKTQ